MTEARCDFCGATLQGGTPHRCQSLVVTGKGRRDATAVDVQVDGDVGADTDENDPLVGTMLGESYRVLERLGAGGMGTVYLVVHVHLKKRFAAKILHAHAARRPEALARFEQEAVAASRLEHENIVNVVDFGKGDSGLVYLVMEFLKGQTLDQVLSRGALSLPDAARVTAQICQGLSAAHGAGIVHRDLKPDNVFLARRATGPHLVKLLDFGISKIKEQRLLMDRRLTQTGDVLGSPLYMSPEASRGASDVDARADIYAVGVMLYEMVAGRVPFMAENYLQVLHMQVNQPPRPPSDLCPDLPPALEAVILRALEKDPAARFAGTQELEIALRAALPDVDFDAPLEEVFDPPSAPIVASVPLPSVLPRATPALEKPTSIEGAETVSMRTGATPAPLDAAARATPRSAARRRVLLAAAAVAILAIGLGVGLLAGSRSGPRASVRAELAVESTPPGAQVLLDGEPLGQTPLTAEIVRDGKDHRVIVELAGYRTHTRIVRLDRDRALAVALEPATP